MKNRLKKYVRAKKGSVLISSLILLFVAAAAVLSLVKFVTDSQKAAARDRGFISAFYAAESGVERVVDYFNNPLNYTDSTPSNYTDNSLNQHPATYADVAAFAPNDYGVFEPYWNAVAFDGDGNTVVTGSTYFANLYLNSALDVSLTSKVPSYTMNVENVEGIEFGPTENVVSSWVSRIEVQNPNDIPDLANIIASNSVPVICKIIATGTTTEGVDVSVESIITESRARGFDSPAAILSKQAVDFNGQFNVFWGELWSQSNVDLPSNWLNKVPQFNTTFSDGRGGAPQDQWFGIRSEEWIVDNRGNYANGFTTGRNGGSPQFTNNQPNSNSDEYEKPFDKSGEIEDYKNFFQNQTLDWPEYDYDEWKEFVQEFDFPYFYADTDGELWGEDETGALVKKSFEEWFDANDPSSADYWELENIIVFIDGVPQNDSGQTSSSIDGEYYPRHPDDPDKVDVTIRLAGGGLHTRGVMLVSPDMKMTGQGNTGVTGDDIPLTAGGGFLMPDGAAYSGDNRVDIFHHGLLWGYGQMDLGGNRTIYGSIHAADGYGQGGSPTVWYNARMQDGGWISLNRSRVKRDLWNISKNPAPEEGDY